MNTQVSALVFFPQDHARAARSRPRGLSHEAAACALGRDVARLLEAAPGPGLKYKAALSVAYGAGSRRSEVVALRVCDIDSKRMLIRVEHQTIRRTALCTLDRHARPG
jgi:integrase/recombinase XerD